MRASGPEHPLDFTVAEDDPAALETAVHERVERRWRRGTGMASPMGEEKPSGADVPLIDFTRAVLCLDCEGVFPVRPQGCPRCAAETFVPLKRFLSQQSSAAWIGRRTVDEARQVRLADVLHHAGNALTPGRAYAERLIGLVEIASSTGYTQFLKLAASYGERIVTSIDNAMDRLYALAEPAPPAGGAR